MPKKMESRPTLALRRLLPSDPRLRTKLGDNMTECALSHHYFVWASRKENAEIEAGNTSRADFLSLEVFFAMTIMRIMHRRLEQKE